MINFSPSFISCVPVETPSGLPKYYPQNNTLHQVVRHIRHIGELIGYDHVGLGSDFDGIGSTPKGLEDVSKFPDLVAELLRQGVSDKDVGKIVGRNILRVWKEADEVAAKLQATTVPLEDDLQSEWGYSALATGTTTSATSMADQEELQIMAKAVREKISKVDSRVGKIEEEIAAISKNSHGYGSKVMVFENTNLGGQRGGLHGFKKTDDLRNKHLDRLVNEIKELHEERSVLEQQLQELHTEGQI